MASYYLYILYSASSDRYYVGYSADVASRLAQHNSSVRPTYTSKHRPWTLAKQLALGEDRGFAVRIERGVKRMKSRKFLEWIISDVQDVSELAQSVGVPTCRD